MGGHVWEVTLTPRPCVCMLQVMSVAFSSDGHHLASGSGDRTGRVWEVTTGGGGGQLFNGGAGGQRGGGNVFKCVCVCVCLTCLLVPPVPPHLLAECAQVVEGHTDMVRLVVVM